MAVSSAAQLTKQFYEWECKGRGYVTVDYTAELEPPFIPFFGHFIDTPYIDDGKQHTFLSKVKGYFVPEHTVSLSEPPKQEVVAFEDTEHRPDITIYSITLPKQYCCKAESIERCLTMLSLCQQMMSFEIIATASQIFTQITCRDSNASFIYTQLKAYFPECVIQETYDDEVLNCAELMQPAYTVDFGLRDEFMCPIASYSNGNFDPYTSLFSTFEQLQEDETVIVQVLFCGTQNAWAESVITSVTDDNGKSFFIDAPDMPKLAKEKVSSPLLAVTVRIAAFADDLDDAGVLLRHSALALIQASTSSNNALTPLGNPEYTVEQRLCDLVLRQTHRLGMLLNTKELALLAHLPDTRLSKKLFKNEGTTKQAPSILRNQSYVLGLNEHQGKSVSVGINTEQRLKHLHILGATGTGKSTLTHSLICQDMQHGVGCCVLDPHGDVIDTVLRSVPKERINDVVLIDPSDSDYPVGFNILSAHSDLERELLASDLVALFKRFSTSWGDQLHSVLANAVMAFLYNRHPGHLGDLRKFLIEPQFRTHVLSSCTDEELIYYWQKEYPLLKTSSIGSILTRLDSFLRPKPIRNMVCQHKGLDFTALMDSKKIILVKLSQGLIGAENSYLLGACIVAKLQQAAMARQQQSIASRQPFFCYIDEFHHFVTESMNSILSGARKYSFGLVLVHQDMAQVQKHDADIASSLMSNVGTRICFRLSDTDAKRMQEGFSTFIAQDLQNLATGEAIARVNTADADFNLHVIKAEIENEDYTNEIIENSRALYAVSLQVPPPVAPIVEAPPVQTTEPVTQPIPPTIRPPVADKPIQNTQEHRYLQAFIKTMAEQNGYKAFMELPTADGKGQIDVVLEKDTERIAIEVSVSTSAEWEFHNIQKCLADNFSSIMVCTDNKKKLQHIGQKMQETLNSTELSRIRLITTEEIPTLFSSNTVPSSAVTTMKGYRVKVKYEDNSHDPNAEDIIKRIIKNSK